MEGDPVTVNQRHGIIISIHALRVEGDANYYEYSPEELISIHALRVEGDIGAIIMDMPALQFLSTPSGWRATSDTQNKRRHAKFLSTPSGWRATCGGDHAEMEGIIFLSTPSGWRATTVCRRCGGSRLYFYPRPPGGGRPVSPGQVLTLTAFLSTPSGWRATLRQHQFHSACTHFYPRPPGGGRPPIENSLGTIYVISIHALRVEGDCGNARKVIFVVHISIHALRVEGDRGRVSK